MTSVTNPGLKALSSFLRVRPAGRLCIGCSALALVLTGCDPSKQAKPLPSEATAPAVEQTAPPAVIAPPLPSPAELQQKGVHALIKQVESAYSRGETNYRRGKLPEARREFDRAVDLMLSSGFDIKNDAALSAEFDKVVDGVAALELEALKVGNGFTPQQEPTPADVAVEATFTFDPGILARAQKDLATTKSDLPLVVNEYVATYINFFANTKKGHNTLLHSFERSGRYKAMIERVMAEEGVPQDLIYLAVAESGFQPRALNPSSHAGGMWQFMPYGNYGLARTAWVDERFDPEKSTRAYARYMKFLYNQMGDWYLAMASYNWGAGNVQRAVMKTGYSDFWELYKRNNLPAETKNYVPEILAAIIIANNPTQYGFDEITLNAPVQTDTVTVNYSVSLRLVADIVGAPVEELAALNPSLLRGVTPPDAAFDLHLPPGASELFTKRIASIPESKRSSWRYRRVSEGDTLASVAREYRITESNLADANRLEEGAALKGLDGLAVPTATPLAAPASSASTSASSSATAAVAAAAARAQFYTTRRGDTLVTIADRFGVSLAQLRSWNKISGVKVTAGRKLRVSDSGVGSSVSARSRRRAAASAAEAPQTTSSSKKGAKNARGAKNAKSAKAAPAAPEAAAPRTGKRATKSAESAHAPHAASSAKSAPSAKKSGTPTPAPHKKTNARK